MRRGQKTRRYNSLERILSRTVRDPDTGCWCWTGARSGGYGHVQVGGAVRETHSVVYELVRGAVPRGLQLDHLCRLRCCVNPEHLEPVTRKENILRGTSQQAANAHKIHCGHGHELSGTNVRITRNGRRACRACGRRWTNEAHARGRLRPSSSLTRTQCAAGHVLNEESAWRTTYGHWRCRVCDLTAQRRRYARRRVEAVTLADLAHAEGAA